jgi:hypothetical protein
MSCIIAVANTVQNTIKLITKNLITLSRNSHKTSVSKKKASHSGWYIYGTVTSHELYKKNCKFLLRKYFQYCCRITKQLVKLLKIRLTMSRKFLCLEDLGWQARHHRRIHALHSWKYATVTRTQGSQVQFEVTKLVFVYLGQKRFGKNVLR